MKRVRQRGETVSVAKQHAQRLSRSERFGALCDVFALRIPIPQLDLFDEAGLAFLGGVHLFDAAISVELNHAPRCGDDFRTGAIVGFQKENRRAGMVAFKLHQDIGLCAAEAVDALILVAH